MAKLLRSRVEREDKMYPALKGELYLASCTGRAILAEILWSYSCKGRSDFFAGVLERNHDKEIEESLNQL